MSLEKQSTMKQSYLVFSECRWDWIRLGNGGSTKGGYIRESKNNGCYASNHRHGGVCEVGMLRSVIETSREILISVVRKHDPNTTSGTSFDEAILAYEEVGVAHSSVEAPVMGRRAKEPYLVDVNREAKEMRWQIN